MKKFADLSKSQKSFCVRILDVCPEYAKEKTLTLKQISAGYFLLKAERGSTKEKLGFPLWLQKTQIVARGVYEMPWASSGEVTVWKTTKNTPKALKVAKAAKSTVTKLVAIAAKSRLEKIVEDSPVHTAEVEEFNRILKENGIEV